eukprot:Plantae.Rhodophyta-Hildenbrandia_rubra.ctg21434.p1 GENE.Plantae.Rhodophyta-Hildenbrandia_rubra.ctg21434~~Plantae.Rhodophyta-Hildenbrandia_rubra.ctg21434.p1  ORF type:complete len:656 (+),score=68.39 Plantae.Rhodophyta-Hildenbrandia_rubra.ctg21434:355-2322(+)
MDQTSPKIWMILLVIVPVLFDCFYFTTGEIATEPCMITAADRDALKMEAKRMFYHGYNAYKKYAMPKDELRSLSCTGIDSFGGVALTLIDSLDTLAVFGDWEEFIWAVKYVERTLGPWNSINATVSLFETNIRVLGGLLSAHGILTEAGDEIGFNATQWYPSYNSKLLTLAVELADILMSAFKTKTAIPFGAVHLQMGILPNESRIACVAGAGSLLLEFGTLSRLTGDEKYYLAAFNAMDQIWKYRSQANLVGNHIDTTNGMWVAREAGVAGTVDSYYEYMLKGYILFGDERLLDMIRTSFTAIEKYLAHGPWYLNADYETRQFTSLYQSSLAAFFFGLQIMDGEIDSAIASIRAHYTAWRRYGCLPEGYVPYTKKPMEGQINYPLRPELIESTFYAHWATNDSSWIAIARNMMYSIEKLAKTECGYARIRNVATHDLEDWMDSFFLSETTKYLYLVFSENHWIRSGKFVLTTEAHPLLVTTWTPPFQSDSLVTSNGNETKHRVSKCKRRGRLEAHSSCGFAMAGSDLPEFDLDTVLGNRIPQRVRNIFRARLANQSIENIEDIVIEKERIYRVQQIPGQKANEYYVTELSQSDEQEVRVNQSNKKQMSCYVALIHERLQEIEVLQTPSITPADELSTWTHCASRQVCYREEALA